MSRFLGCTTLSAIFILAAQPAEAGNPPDWDAITGAARQLSQQLDFFQQTLLTDPAPTQGRGLFKQSGEIITSMIYFRQQLKRKVSRDQLYLAFEKVDQQVKQLQDDIAAFEKWDAPLKMAAGKLLSATHDLQFALTTGDGGAQRQGQALYRQTLVLMARTEDLAMTVQWVYFERPPLKAWTSDIKALKQTIAAFQKLQQDKASAQQLKEQFLQAEQSWAKLVERYNQAGNDQALLRGPVAGVDQVFARLAPLLGVKDRRPPLTNGLD